MTSRAIRPRNLDVTKKLQIRRVEDVTFKEGDATISVSTANRGTVQKVVESKKTFIPVPETKKVSNIIVKKEFKQPLRYIHFTNCTGAKIITEHDQYDLLQDDIEWMNQFNQKNPKERYPLNEDAMEAMIDLFEKQAWLVTKRVDPSIDYPLTQALTDAAEHLSIRAKIAEKVYTYWKTKRLKLDKALMRKFQQPPPLEDNNPHIAFRQRVPETGRRMSCRNPKKNDRAGFDKMKVLRKDFNRLLQIVDQMRDRETLKRDLHLIDTEILDKKLEGVITTKLKESKEVKGLLVSKLPKCPAHRKVVEIFRSRKRDKPHYRRHKSSKEKIPHSPQVTEMSEDDFFSETDDSDREFYENLENWKYEEQMRNDGLSPRKLLPDFGFPAPHWLPGWERSLDECLPSIESIRKRTEAAQNGTEISNNSDESRMDSQNRTPVNDVPVHKSFHRHRGRFCGRVGRGGRLFLMVKVRGRGRGQGYKRNFGMTYSDPYDDLEDEDTDEIKL
mmetsp:Transcript_4483/g.6706  ORF Transcript_4483/g.6706 Transcript_4483/m.6706 type:complete len:501 (+) Transcript_4483:90-1592(+)